MSKSDDDILVITTPRRYGKWAEWNRHRNEAVKFAPLGVDYSGPASRQPGVEITRDATHVLRCAKCEGESSGTARDAGKRCTCGGSLSLCRKLEPEPQRPTYRIPAREVVPGMMYVPANGTGASEITEIGRRTGGLLLWWGQSGSWADVDQYVNIQLPGPSPRELACMCPVWGVDWVRENGLQGAGMAVCEPLWRGRAAHQHQGVCPVAPVPGRHGGMRLWPAPWRGAAWSWDSTPGTDRYLDGKGRPQISTTGLGRVSYGIATDRDWADAMLQCFYLPPAPHPERREPTPWAPHAGYDDLAVRYG